MNRESVLEAVRQYHQSKAQATYLTSSQYSAEHDSGIRWDSVGFQWLVMKPIVSARDQSFAPLEAFASPWR